MRRLLLALALWASASTAWAHPAITLVPGSITTCSHDNSTTCDLTLGTSLAIGDLAACVAGSSTTLTSLVELTFSTPLTTLFNTTGGYRHVVAAGIMTSAGAPRFLLTLPSGDSIALTCMGFSGSFSGTILDVDGGSQVTAATTNHSQSITVGAASVVILSAISTSVVTNTLAPNCTGCVEASEATNLGPNGLNLQVMYKILTGGGAFSMAWTSAPTADDARHYVASFKEVAAAPTAGDGIGFGISTGRFIQ